MKKFIPIIATAVFLIVACIPAFDPSSVADATLADSACGAALLVERHAEFSANNGERSRNRDLQR